MPTVNIPNVGSVTFPDSMSAQDIQHAIETDIMPSQTAGGGAGDAQAKLYPNGMIEAEDDLTSKALRAQRRVSSFGGQVSNYIKEGAFNTVAGMGQAVSALADPVLPGTLENYNRSVEGIKSDRVQHFEDAYGKAPSELADTAATVGVGLGLNPRMGAASAAGAIAKGFGVGAFFGGTAYQKGADTLGEKALWAGAGGVLGSLIGTVPAAYIGLKNVARKYLTADPLPDAAAAADAVQKAIPGLQGQLTMGQQTGKFTTISTEAKVAKEEAQRQWISQAKIVQEHLADTAKKYGPILAPEEAVKRGQLALINTRKAMRETRKDLWDADLGAIRTKVEADHFAEEGIEGTHQVLIEMPGLRDPIKAIVDDFGGTLSPTIKKALEELDTFEGHLSFDTLENLLEKVNGNNFTVLSGVASEGANKAAAVQMRNTIMETLGKVDDNTEIGAMLKTMRDGYSKRSQAIREFENTAAARILGIKKGTLVENPEQALKAIYRLGPSSAQKLATVLKQADPAVLNSLRGGNIKSALESSMNQAAKPGSPKFDVEKFIKTTVGDGKLRGAGLYDAGDASTLAENTKALGALLNAAPFRAAIAEPEQGLMAAASRAPAFVLRNLFRMFGNGPLERVMFDPKARNSFLKATRYVQTGKADQATNIVARLLSQYSVPDEQDSTEDPAN